MEVASNSFTLKDSSGAVTSSIYPFKLIPFASGPISLVEWGWYLDYELPFLFFVSLDRGAKVLPGQPPPPLEMEGQAIIAEVVNYPKKC